MEAGGKHRGLGQERGRDKNVRARERLVTNYVKFWIFKEGYGWEFSATMGNLR